MVISVPAAVQDAVEGLYAGIFRHTFEQFKENTLRSLKTVLPFDSAVWGSGLHSTNAMLSLTLLDQPVEMLMAYAEGWQVEDRCRNAAVAEPGRAFRNEDLQPVEQYRQTAIYTQFCKSWAIEQALTIVLVRQTSDLAEIICLFRAGIDEPFTDAERALLEHLGPHIAAAWHQAQIAHFYRRAGLEESIGVVEPDRYAVVDGLGVLQAAGDAFCQAVMALVPDWRGPLLPTALMPVVRGERDALTIGETEFRRRKSADGMILAAMPASGVFGLTAAELRAARLYADGLTQPEIAALLGISASTVRNQLSAAYGKLKIRSKVDLVRVLRRGEV